MRKEPIIHYIQDQPYVYGYEILAENPSLIKTLEDDFYVFKSNILLLKDIFDKDKVYHFNLQGRTILNFEKDVLNLIKNSSYRDNVVIELLENDLNSKELDEVFELFSKESIKVSLDDFGTASSNFDRLIEYKHIVESVKIDRILWKNMLGVVGEILKFCKDNNIKVICEKVETKEELDSLFSVGVRYFQGWYFKKIKVRESKEKAVLTREKIAQLSKEAYDITAKYNSNLNYDEFLENLRLLLLSHDLDIKFGSEEFFKLKDLINQTQNQPAKDSNSYFVDKSIIALKELKANTLYKIKELKNLNSSIKKVILESKNDTLFNVIRSLDEYIKFLQQKVIELESVSSKVKGSDFYQRRKKLLREELLSRFARFKKNQIDFFVGCIYLRGLFEEANSGNEIPLYDMQKILEKLSGQLKLFFGENTFVIQTEDFMVNFVSEKVNEKMLSSLQDKINKQEFTVKGKPVNLKAKVCVVKPSESDENFEDFMLRLEMNMYEMKFY